MTLLLYTRTDPNLSIAKKTGPEPVSIFITCGDDFQMVDATGIEPVTPTMSTWYSNHLSYASMQFVEAAPRFELGMRILQTLALPLGYAALFMERVTRFELATTCLGSKDSTAELHPPAGMYIIT